MSHGRGGPYEEMPTHVRSSARVRLTREHISVRIGGGCFCSFDLEGRPIGVLRRKRSYWRGLDNRVLTKWGGGADLYRRRRRVLSECRRDVLFRSVRKMLLEMAECAEQGVVQVECEEKADPLVSEAARDWPERLLGWDAKRLRDEQTRFASVYRPVGILPPDQYPAVVVQLVEGCPWNACSFCTLYKDRAFRIRSGDDIEVHLSRIRRFFGEGLRLRKTVFLGDANALSMPQERLISTMNLIRERLPMVPEGLTRQERAGWKRSHPQALEGFYAFMDVFGDDRRTDTQFRELRRHGMKRLYLGAEAGDNKLLRILNKPATVEQLIDAANRVKDGGLQLGVIFMLGVGGQAYAALHERSLVDVCGRLPLSPGDIVYLSPLMAGRDSAYGDWSRREGNHPLSSDELAHQEQRVVSRLRRTVPVGVRVAPYDLREFVY